MNLLQAAATVGRLVRSGAQSAVRDLKTAVGTEVRASVARVREQLTTAVTEEAVRARANVADAIASGGIAVAAGVAPKGNKYERALAWLGTAEKRRRVLILAGVAVALAVVLYVVVRKR